MKKLSNSSASIILTVCLIYMTAFMIVSPSKAVSSAMNATVLCGKTVIPSLFTFIFCSNMLVSLGFARMISRYLTRFMYPFFNVTGSGAFVLVMGMLSGYPVGASCAVSLYKSAECTKCEAERLMAFCNNSGPMFVIGAVGCGMLGSRDAGVFLYVVHIVSAIICGMVLKVIYRGGSNDNTETERRLLSSSNKNIKTSVIDMGGAVSQSVDTMMKICGFVIVFSVFVSVIPDFGYKKYIFAFFEITGGIAELIDFDTPLPIISMFLAFSGISVFAQVSAIALPEGLSLKPYLLGKIIQAFTAYCLSYGYIKFFPLSVKTFSGISELYAQAVDSRILIYTSLISVIFSLCVLGVMALISRIISFKDHRDG